MVMRYADEPCLCEGCCVVRQPNGAQAGEGAEDEVQRAHEDVCREAHASLWNAKVGDEPESAWRERRCDAGNEGFEIALGEAIEKEMGDDEVVSFGRSEGECAGAVSFEACGVGFAALAQKLEHGCAGVYSIGVDIWVRDHEGREETPVSVAENERSFLTNEIWEEMQAAAFEGTAEGKIFEPSVRTRDPIEVRSRVHRGRKATRRTGASSTRSATVRSVSG